MVSEHKVRGRATQPTRVKSGLAGAGRTSPRNTDREDAPGTDLLSLFHRGNPEGFPYGVRLRRPVTPSLPHLGKCLLGEKTIFSPQTPLFCESRVYALANKKRAS